LIYKPNAQGIYQAISSDGKSHTLAVVTGQGVYRDVTTQCVECKWEHFGYRAAKTDLTQARIRDWYEHVEHYELVMGLSPPPPSLWMGAWTSSRRIGALFAFRFDANMPSRSGWASNPMHGIREARNNVHKRRWSSPWAVNRPWHLIDSSGWKKDGIYNVHKTVAICTDMGEIQRAAHKELSDRAAKGELVDYPGPGSIDMPEGIEVPLPPIDAFVAHMIKVAQTANYGEILKALEQVKRGVTQLELLKEVEVALEAKLTIGP
jgi:hypothetical protein